MIAHIEFPYGWDTRFKKMPDAEWEAVKLRLIELLPEFEHDFVNATAVTDPVEGGELRRWYVTNKTMVDLATDGLGLSLLGIEYTVKRFKGAYHVKDVTASSPSSPSTVNNTTIQVAIPDLALLNIRTVQVVEDSCTDVLQSKLDKGWRILAICPPHAQRRPDYIIGHTDATPN